jgi:hypothetical protein
MIAAVGRPDVDTDLGVAGAPSFIRAVAGCLVLAGVGLAVLRFSGGTPAEDGLEGAAGSFALGAVVMATGVLAALALRDRPVLLLPAAIVLVPLSFLSFAFVTAPLLAPAVLLCIGYARRSRRHPLPAWRVALAVVVVFASLIGAVAALVVHQDPREYVTATSAGSTSDVITGAEAAISMALTASGVAFGWVLGAPDVRRRGRGASRRRP